MLINTNLSVHDVIDKMHILIQDDELIQLGYVLSGGSTAARVFVFKGIKFLNKRDYFYSVTIDDIKEFTSLMIEFNKDKCTDDNKCIEEKYRKLFENYII